MRWICLALLLCLSTGAHAYIGPGAGLNVLGSLWAVLVGIVLALFAILTWPEHAVHPGAWASLAALGVFCTAVALLAFYQLIALAGSFRAGMITYLNPVVAVVLGVLLLSEPLRWSTIVGFALVATGCWLSTRHSAPAATLEPLPAAELALIAPPHGQERSDENAGAGTTRLGA